MTIICPSGLVVAVSDRVANAAMNFSELPRTEMLNEGESVLLKFSKVSDR